MIVIGQLCCDPFVVRNNEQKMEPTFAAVDKQAIVHWHNTVTAEIMIWTDKNMFNQHVFKDTHALHKQQSTVMRISASYRFPLLSHIKF